MTVKEIDALVHEFVPNCIPRMPSAVHLRIYNSTICSWPKY